MAQTTVMALGQTAASVSPPAGIIDLDIGHELGGSNFFGHIKNLRIYGETLNATQVGRISV